MVKHIVMWKFKDEVAEKDKATLKANMQKALTGLLGEVPGLLSVDFRSELLPSSTHDMALVTELESADALKAYSAHPSHVAVADTYVRPFVCDRSCLDYEG